MSRVLVVDDEEALLDIVGDIVGSLGHDVIRAHDGEEALALAQRAPPDLIVSDFMMPRRTGLGLLDAVRADAALASVPFILMSAARPPVSLVATAFLAKPVGLEILEASVRAALQDVRAGVHGTGAGSSTGPRALPAGAADELLNWVAHELKTPLSAVRLNAEIALRQADRGDDPAARRPAAVILRQVERMRGLIDAILDAASLADGQAILRCERRDLRDFLGDAVCEWREQAPGVALVLTLPDAPVHADIDPVRLRQVLDNLLSNAVKYGLPAGPVGVTLEVGPSRAVIVVTDQGPGIAASEVPHLFERFRRAADAKGRGHGLGLFIASELTRLHGGTLRVQSTVGQGATFSLTLPTATG